MKYPFVLIFTVTITIVSTAILMGTGYSFEKERRNNLDELLRECVHAAQEAQIWAKARWDTKRNDPFAGITLKNVGYSSSGIMNGSLQLDRIKTGEFQLTCSNAHFGNRVTLQVKGLRNRDIHLAPLQQRAQSDSHY